jgi:hypothetical protein
VLASLRRDQQTARWSGTAKRTALMFERSCFDEDKFDDIMIVVGDIVRIVQAHHGHADDAQDWAQGRTWA